MTTTNEDGTTNVAPMGPVVEDTGLEHFLLRPFQTSTTFKNLKRTQAGVLHITDDVNLFVDGALTSWTEVPEFREAERISGKIIASCCRYFEFITLNINADQPRTEIECQVVARNELRPFLGFNRAKNAILEMAILATRVHILDKALISQQLGFLKSAIEKTGSNQELDCFEKLKRFFNQQGLEL